MPELAPHTPDNGPCARCGAIATARVWVRVTTSIQNIVVPEGHTWVCVDKETCDMFIRLELESP